MRLKYKDGHKTHYASRLTTFRSASFKTYYEGKFVQASERGTFDFSQGHVTKNQPVAVPV